MKTIKQFIHGVLLFAGVVALLVTGLVLTPIPWRVYNWLCTDETVLQGNPEYIVILGGGGIPSESGLIRCYYGALAANEFPEAKIIVALPDEGTGENSSLRKMAYELMRRDVEPERILSEKKGRNTREQAVLIRALLGSTPGQVSMLIVTSNTHMRRAMMTFRAAGFEKAAPYQASGISLDMDLTYQDKELGGQRAVMTSGELQIWLRYGVWNNVQYLTRSLRELVAISYYK